MRSFLMILPMRIKQLVAVLRPCTRANRLGSCGFLLEPLSLCLEPTVAHARATQMMPIGCKQKVLLFPRACFAVIGSCCRMSRGARKSCWDADGSIDEVRARTRQLLSDLIPGI